MEGNHRDALSEKKPSLLKLPPLPLKLYMYASTRSLGLTMWMEKVMSSTEPMLRL